jgi:D-xylose transport system substrate-binding protein
VSFDNVKVGQLQGQGLVSCLSGGAAGAVVPRVLELDGSPDDNNATLFRQGYRSVIDPLVKAGKMQLVGDEAVPQWDPATGGKLFAGMLAKAGGRVDAVLAANDGLGGAAIKVLDEAGHPAVPVTGQDATVEGILNILAGKQCLTIFKDPKVEAAAAAKLTVALVHGTEPPAGLVNGTTDDGARAVPSILGTPVAVTKDNVKSLLIDSGAVKRSELCAGDGAAICEKAGI